jgi:hypothetical protein
VREICKGDTIPELTVLGGDELRAGMRVWGFSDYTGRLILNWRPLTVDTDAEARADDRHRVNVSNPVDGPTYLTFGLRDVVLVEAASLNPPR